MLGINGIIGAGIFLTPGTVIKLAGPNAPLAFILAGLFTGVMAVVFATAARYVKTNGAAYAYTCLLYTSFFGFWVRRLILPALARPGDVLRGSGCSRTASMTRLAVEYPLHFRPARRPIKPTHASSPTAFYRTNVRLRIVVKRIFNFKTCS